MKSLYTFLFSLSFLSLFAQMELVPNGNFESNSGTEICNNLSCDISEPCDPDFCCQIPCEKANLSGKAIPWENVGLVGEDRRPELFDDRWKPCSGALSDCDELGMGVNPANTNYLGIKQSVRSSGHRHAHLQAGPAGRNDGIGIQLKHPLAIGRTYVLKFYAVNKNTGNFFGNIPDCDLKVRLGSENNWIKSHKTQQTVSISGIAGDPDTWQEVTMSFTVNDCDIDFLMIRHEGQIAGKRHVLLDDISLFDPYCNKCNSDEDGAVMANIHTNGMHTPTQPLTFFGLETVRSFNLKIYLGNGSQVKRNLTLSNPFNTYSWDGKNDLGAFVANAYYSYELQVDNDCSCKTLKGSFTKTGNYITNPNNPDPIKNAFQSSSLPITFSGLETVTLFDLKIKQGTTILRNLVISNPANTVAWDGKDNFGNVLPPDQYSYSLALKNNCNTNNLGAFFTMPASYPIYSAYYDYASTPKPNTPFLIPIYFPCECTDNCENYDRPPLPCCSDKPDLHLQNTLITLTKEYKIINNIKAGPGVTVLSSSDVLFQAGNSIVLDTGFSTQLGAKFEAEISPCLLRITDSSHTSSSADNNDNVVVQNQKNPGLNESELLIIPNPSNDGLFYCMIKNNVSAKGNVAINISSVLGEIIYTSNNVHSLSSVIDISSHPKGIYFVKVQSGDNVYTEKVVVQ